MNVLLAEDENEIRLILKDIVEELGHHCTEAADGRIATQILERNENFQLLISDFRMPHMDGAQLLQWCRDHKIHFPVIFLTANASLLQKENLVLSGHRAALLRKPVNLEELLSAIEAAEQRLIPAAS
ncbi:MAG: response regulator [Bdellovibrionota bacterium]